MIRLNRLSRSFAGRTLFESGELEAPRSGLVALRGANGSGKTTLLRILSTLTAPSAGEAWVGGHSVVSAPARARAALGFVPAGGGGMFRKLTGRENLLLFGGLCGMTPRQSREAIERCRATLDIEQALETRFGVASSGMRQSLLLCRALMHGPDVLLLDEPSRALDAGARERLWQALEGLAESKLVLYSTHEDGERSRADLIWEIRDGVLECSAS